MIDTPRATPQPATQTSAPSHRPPPVFWFWRWGIWIAAPLAWVIGWTPMLFTEDAVWRSNIGGMFGIVGTLISALAFSGLIVTIRMQQRQVAATEVAQRDSEGALIRQQTALEDLVNELVSQRRLSVMPAFTLAIGVQNDPGVLYIKNIGTGPGFNIRIKPLKLYADIITDPEGRIHFDFLTYLSGPSDFKGVGSQAIGKESKPNVYEAWMQQAGPNSRSLLTFEIFFDDVEGRIYYQTVQLAGGVAIPGRVRLFRDAPDPKFGAPETEPEMFFKGLLQP